MRGVPGAVRREPQLVPGRSWDAYDVRPCPRRGNFAVCPERDSNPHWIGFEPNASASWAIGAAVLR